MTYSYEKDDIHLSPAVEDAMRKLRSFMFERVYQNKAAKSQEAKAEMLMESLYQYYLKHLHKLPPHLLARMEEHGEAPEMIVCDYPYATESCFHPGAESPVWQYRPVCCTRLLRIRPAKQPSTPESYF